MSFSTLLGCQHCKQPFQPSNKRQRFCSAKCRAAANYLPVKLLNQDRKLARFRIRRGAIALGFDGRSSGPVNSSQLGDRFTVVEILMHLLATSEKQLRENSDGKL